MKTSPVSLTPALLDLPRFGLSVSRKIESFSLRLKPMIRRNRRRNRLFAESSVPATSTDSACTWPSRPTLNDIFSSFELHCSWAAAGCAAPSSAAVKRIANAPAVPLALTRAPFWPLRPKQTDGKPIGRDRHHDPENKRIDQEKSTAHASF